MEHKQITGRDWDWSIEGVVKREPKFRYMLLDRMRSDCEYFLGCGNRNPYNLWCIGDVDGQIEYMKAIWNSFTEKPEWLTIEQINEYERLMKPNIEEKSRRKEYSGWYCKEVERVVFFIDGHFLHHQIEGDIPQYDKDRYDRAMREKINRYQQTGGQWIDCSPDRYENQFSGLNRRGPIGFIEHARKEGWTFREPTSISYCENGKCWFFGGNFWEVSASFDFCIYTKELADKVRAMVPEVEYHEDDSVIL